MFSLLVSSAFAGDSSFNSILEKRFKEAEELKLPEVKNRNEEEMKKKAENVYRIYQEKVKPKVEEWKEKIQYDGKSVRIAEGNGKSKTDKKQSSEIFKDDERLYIFMSSSVPLSVWRGYATVLDRLKTDRIAMVLRGCIGGCRYIKPTLEFLQKVIKPDEHTEYYALIEIDPLLFRKYKIKEVPCFVYARGLQVDRADLSEGWEKNIKREPKFWISCGDWAFGYHIEKLERESHSESLKRLLTELRKSWFLEKSSKSFFLENSDSREKNEKRTKKGKR